MKITKDMEGRKVCRDQWPDGEEWVEVRSVSRNGNEFAGEDKNGVLNTYDTGDGFNDTKWEFYTEPEPEKKPSERFLVLSAGQLIPAGSSVFGFSPEPEREPFVYYTDQQIKKLLKILDELWESGAFRPCTRCAHEETNK